MKELSYFDSPTFLFDKELHRYTLDGEPLTSATTYIKQFGEEFNTEIESIRYADKYNLDVKEVLDLWNLRGKISRDEGTATHEWIESLLLNQPTDHPENPYVSERTKAFEKFHKENLYSHQTVAIEKRLFYKPKLLAGTIDALLYSERKKELQLWDWKTNGDGKFKTDKDKHYKNLLSPFNDLKDNELNKYSIQLSLYRIFLEQADIHVTNAFLCHIPPSGVVTVHKAKDLRKELKEILWH